MTSDTGPSFDLWLETETGEPVNQTANRPNANFCNILIALEDGRRYALNVWTFDFLPLARYPWPYEMRPGVEPTDYLLPPDLFVSDFSRTTITSVVEQLLKEDELRDEWLVKDD